MDTLNTLIGERGLGHEGDRVKPIATTYLLTIFFIRHPPKELGLRTERELRTLMLCIDHLIRGDLGRALDVMCQRVKALEKSVIDQNWNTARWLELIPTSEAMLIPRDEARAAIREGEAEARVRRALTTQPPLPNPFPTRTATARAPWNQTRRTGPAPTGGQMLALPPPPDPPYQTGGKGKRRR